MSNLIYLYDYEPLIEGTSRSEQLVNGRWVEVVHLDEEKA